MEKYNTVRQADSYCGGYMLRKCQGENLRSDSTLHIRSLPHDLVTGGIPHAGFRQDAFINKLMDKLAGQFSSYVNGIYYDEPSGSL